MHRKMVIMRYINLDVHGCLILKIENTLASLQHVVLQLGKQNDITVNQTDAIIVLMHATHNRLEISPLSHFMWQRGLFLVYS